MTDGGLDKTRRGRRVTRSNSARMDSFSPMQEGPVDAGLSLWGASTASFAEQTEQDEALNEKAAGPSSSATERVASPAPFEGNCAMPAGNAAHMRGVRPQDLISSDPAQLAKEERERRIREFHEHAYLRAGLSPHEAGLEAAGQAAAVGAGLSAVAGTIGSTIPLNQAAPGYEPALAATGQGLGTGAELAEATVNSRGEDRWGKYRNAGVVAGGALVGGAVGMLAGPAGALIGAAAGGSLAGGLMAGGETYVKAKERERTGRAHPDDWSPMAQAVMMGTGGALVGAVGGAATVLEAPVLAGAAAVGTAAAGVAYVAKRHEQRRDNYNRERDAETAFQNGLEPHVANFVSPARAGAPETETEPPALEQVSETEQEQEELARRTSDMLPVRLHQNRRRVAGG
jgi:hypothetical protein